jgi:predicted lipoprotein with Yx(FWY)xxD motif
MKKYFPFVIVLAAVIVFSLGIVSFTSTKTTQTTSTTPSQNTTTNVTTSTTISTPALIALTINNSTKTGIGTFLVDGKGMTLYWTTLDSVGKSNVTGATVALWPVVYIPSIVVPSPLNVSDFGTITRTDGSKQTTYKGYPLYYYTYDQVAGDTFGQGIGGVWFAVNSTATSPAPVISTTSTITTPPTVTPTTTTTTATSTTTPPPTSTTTTPYYSGY